MKKNHFTLYITELPIIQEMNCVKSSIFEIYKNFKKKLRRFPILTFFTNKLENTKLVQRNYQIKKLIF